MSRIKRGTTKNKRKSKILKLAKGYRNARSTKFKQAKQAVIRAGQHSFAHRRKKKRVMRKNWQILISGGLKNAGISYSKFINILTVKGITVNRKMMADMVQNHPESWIRFVESTTGTKMEVVKNTATPAVEKKTEEKSEEVVEKSTEDDLTKVEGIGPKIAETLVAAGIATFAELAKTDSEKIQELISDIKGNHVSDTWPKQAGMAAAGQWDELKTWQDEMDGGIA